MRQNAARLNLDVLFNKSDIEENDGFFRISNIFIDNISNSIMNRISYINRESIFFYDTYTVCVYDMCFSNPFTSFANGI